MKKRLIILIVFALILSGCSGGTIYRTTSAEPDSTEPYCSVFSDSTFSGYARGTYIITATGYGVVCSGRAYNNIESAIAHPIEIQSSGYEIVVTLSNGGAETEIVTLTADSAKIVQCHTIHKGTSAYLYVVVVNSNQ